jgi:Leucine-rich repeat (LRR) protein
MKIFFRNVCRFTAISAAVLAACGIEPTMQKAEGTSEVGNPSIQGCVRDESHAPVRNACVFLRTVPSLPAPVARLKVDSTRTDTSGVFVFDSLDTGGYSLEIISGDTAGALQSVRVGKSDSIVHVQDTIKPLGAISGIVAPSLLTGKDSSFVYIKEIGTLAPVLPDGSFLVPNVPSCSLTVLLVSKDSTASIKPASDTMVVPVAQNATSHVGIDSSKAIMPLTGRVVDSLALVALYKSTNGQKWLTSTNWMSNQPIDTWYGITVANGRVVGISLPSDSLSGVLPAQLAGLDSLTGLNLTTNKISGNIPPQIGNLSKLTYLGLDRNSFSGNIPAELGKLASLLTLRLSYNTLTGQIPAELSQCTQLQTIELEFNNLSGAIPAELANLKVLNFFTAELNSLSGTIPAFPALTYLSLDHNQLTGSILNGNIDFANLTYLSLYNNQLSGPISPLAKCVNLQTCLLNNNNFSGPIPSGISSIKSLQTLDLASNQLTGPIPGEITTLAQLSYLYLDNNLLTDTLPSAIGNLNSLNTLFLNNNQLSGAIPASVGNLSNVEFFNISVNRFSGNVPDIHSLAHLGYAYLGSNLLTGLPDGIDTMTNIVTCDINNDHFCSLSPALQAWANKICPGWDTTQTCP